MERLRKARWTIICMIAGVVLLGAVSAWAQKAWYVDDDPGADFTSIQDGVNAASPGDTVNVAAGTYNESVTVDKSLTLLGAKIDEDPRGGAWTGGVSLITEGAGSAGITITASDVTVNGFEVADFDYGIYTGHGTCDSTTCVVRNVSISCNSLHDNAKYGIQIIGLGENTSVSDVLVTKNYIYDNGRNGLKLVDVTDCTIDANEFNHNGYGVKATKEEYQFGIMLEDERYNSACYHPCIRNTLPGNSFSDNRLGAVVMSLLGTASSSYWSSTSFLDQTIAHCNNFYSDSTAWGIKVDPCYESEVAAGPIATVDATSNWWGHASGPYHVTNPDGLGNKVSDNVLFYPWLNSPYSPVIEVEIDIKPGSEPNSINLKSKGVVPVAVLTTDDFDATTVDPLSVEFGPNGATESHGRGHIEDVDDDGDLDLLLHFKMQELGLTDDSTEASLTGNTYGGTAIMGVDTVNIVPRGKKSAELDILAVAEQLQVLPCPNPVRDVHTTTFRVMGAMASMVEAIRVRIFDLSGRLVWEDETVGNELDWHIENLVGEHLANGMYLYQVWIRIDGMWINKDIGKIAVLR